MSNVENTALLFLCTLQLYIMFALVICFLYFGALCKVNNTAL